MLDDDISLRGNGKSLTGADRYRVGQTLLRDYMVTGVLGEGGMGTVYGVRRISDEAVFAVKTVRSAGLYDFESERLFRRELQTWMSLPEHPNLAACRFFRTLDDDRMAIFAEYVGGGSLQSWIQEGRLSDPAAIIDVAIQFAWGLQAAHACGVVHQDVKPSNALMTESGKVKVTDFGLSRMKHTVGTISASPSMDAPLVSSHGMTPAYCSPEQSKGEKVSFKTDIWSWGVSVLEMFIGRVAWRFGFLAGHFLEAYIADKGTSPVTGVLDSVRQVLERCFRDDPSERWGSMEEAAGALQTVYGSVTSRDYPREQPPVVLRTVKVLPGQEMCPKQSEKELGITWLNQAYHEAGMSAVELRDCLTDLSGTQESRIIAEIDMFDHALRIFSDLIAGGRTDIKPKVAELLIYKSTVHEQILDLPGACLMSEKAIQILDDLFRTDRTHRTGQWTLFLGEAYWRKAHIHHRIRELYSALAAVDSAIWNLEAFSKEDESDTVLWKLALVYELKAVCCTLMKIREGTLAYYEKAIDIRRRIIARDCRPLYRRYLAGIYRNKAEFHRIMGDLTAGASSCDQAIALLETLVDTEGDVLSTIDLSKILLAKTNNLLFSGKKTEAFETSSKAVQIMERVVLEQGLLEFEDVLAWSYLGHSGSCVAQKDMKAAETTLDQAVTLYERLVLNQGRMELLEFLVRSYHNKGYLRHESGDIDTAIQCYDRVIRLIEKHTLSADFPMLQEILANSYSGKALAMKDIGRSEDALTSIDSSIRIISGLLKDKQSANWQKQLTYYGSIKAGIENPQESSGSPDSQDIFS